MSSMSDALIFSDPDKCLALTLLIACYGVTIASLEDLIVLRTYQTSGLFDWDIERSCATWSDRGPLARFTDLWMKSAIFPACVLARIGACAILLTVHCEGTLYSVLLGIILIGLVTITVRTEYGLDGSHQVFTMIFLCLLISSLCPTSRLVKIAVVVFIALQGALSYFVAGYFKLRGETWRNGTALSGILSANAYGNPWLWGVIRHRRKMGYALCWFVILWETLFITVFSPSATWLLACLGMGLCFHLVTAFIMGLNTFLPAFIATYPSIIVTWALLWR